MKPLHIILLYCWIPFVSHAQVSQGGNPLMQGDAHLPSVMKEVIEMPPLPLLASEAAATQGGFRNQPLRFAHKHEVYLTPSNSGVWTQENGLNIWRLAIRSRGAYSLNLIFDQFALPAESRLFIFNEDQSYILGAFNDQNNPPSGLFATSPVPGDVIIVELSVPAGLSREPSLTIRAVNHDFLGIFSLMTVGATRFNTSGNCHPDFTCETAENWVRAGQSVCRIIFDGTELCTGVLVNNTRNDGTPFVLTAAHCLRNLNSHATAIFTFNYQVPNCEARVEGNFTQTISGSHRRAFSTELDMALLEMSSAPPAFFRAYWAGWSRSATPPPPFASIHHPMGDVKKIASATSPLSESSFLSFVPNSHWRVASWASGTTEAGSSGAPLFDANGRVTGILSGGAATCANPVNDFFLRLNRAWNHFTSQNMQLARWLDPEGANPVAVNGFSPGDQGITRLSNFTRSDAAGWEWLVPGRGVWSGHNSLGDNAFAEKFGPFQSIVVHGVYVMPWRSVVGSNQTINLRLWGGNQQPENIVASRENVSLGSVRGNREFLWLLDTPVTVSGNLWAGIEVSYNAVTDSFAVYQSRINPARTVNSAWSRNAGQWQQITQWQAGRFNSSFWIDLLASNVNPVDTFIPVSKDKLLLYPNPVSANLHLKLTTSWAYATAEIFKPTGQLAIFKQLYLDSGEGYINVSSLPPGLYIIRITVQDNIFVSKFNVSR